MLIANHLVSEAARAEAQGMADQQASRLGASDPNRSYRVETVKLSAILGLGNEYQGASVDTTMPLLLEERKMYDGKRLVLSGTQTTAPQMNSLALLRVLQEGGATTWPAVIVTEKVSTKSAKDFETFKKEQDATADDYEEPYEVPVEERSKFTAALLAFLVALMEGTKLLADKTAFDAAMAGASFGGGLSLAQIEGIAHKVAMSQGKYLSGFDDDFSSRAKWFSTARFASQADFEAALKESFFGAAASRAEMYAVGAGQPAWREAVSTAAMADGVDGAVWVCTFAPTTCNDCISLHGRWMTWAALDEIWGNTICNGNCLCGVVPADDPSESAGDIPEEEQAITVEGA